MRYGNHIGLIVGEEQGVDGELFEVNGPAPVFLLVEPAGDERFEVRQHVSCNTNYLYHPMRPFLSPPFFSRVASLASGSGSGIM